MGKLAVTFVVIIILSTSISTQCEFASSGMSNICYAGTFRVGVYDTGHTRDDMNIQFASMSKASTSFFNPNFKVHQATFQAYKGRNDDRTAVLETDYGLIIGVFDGTHKPNFVMPL